ncbi:MAG: 4Fe-4S binding protein [Planctomycetota bacterium]|nr:4Fe-4S binding protein [Planctomycetota bacterium]
MAGEIRVGRGSCCAASGSGEVFRAVQDAVFDLGAPVTVKTVGCVGMCHRVPLVEVVTGGKGGALYAKVRPEDVRAIVRRHFGPRGLVRRLADVFGRGLDSILIGPDAPSPDRCAIDVRDAPVADFLGRQRRLATEGCGELDPLDIEEYIASGGFEALRSCLAGVAPEAVIERIAASGLRGRGGAGFPTARKWAAVRSQGAPDKVVICNGDEGDPGAFMDRMILESFPYRVIEGMALAAYAVGAREGIFYIRAEYPLAVRRVSEALDRCRQRGLLEAGEWKLDLRIMQGAGAFVCGEETALIASIEGRRGMPRLRPPFPAESGLWGRPTLVNNVETYALVPWILRHGAEAFAAIGSGGGRGTKVFALAGKVARGGLIEVPLGATIRQIVEDIGGGIANGKTFKAVQVGGPSGGCIPAELADTPVDFEALTAAGAMMGSGGLVVLDESDCMVDITRYFLQFTQNQSCGKCTFCRIGTRRMLDILERICAGQGHHSDLAALETLARHVKAASLCGLGKTAPNPVLSTLRYFRAEYEAHLAGRCPAGVCKKLITYRITEECIGCTLCAQHCPVGAIDPKPYEKHAIDAEKCIRCNTCRAVCPVSAVKVE